MITKTAKLAQKLVAIPSYVSDTQNESTVIEFLAKYVRENLPAFDIRLSKDIGNGRKNLYLLGKKQPRVVFVGHVDTVQSSDGWLTDPLQPLVKNGRLYGLGAADMKGSIASLLVALQDVEPTLLDEIAVLLYIDEEYLFAGMEQLLKDGIVTKGNEPQLMVSLDGGLEVLSGCRGLIKIDMELAGKSGHASNPENGVNAVTGTMEVMRALEAKLPSYASELGVSTMNVAYLRAGAVADINQPTTLQRAGNVIPNYAECIVELRTASTELNSAVVEKILRAECTARKLTVKSLAVEIDLGVWPGSYKSDTTEFLKQCYGKVGVEYAQADPQYIGFIDVQMLAGTIATPTYVIGAGGENRHGANENVSLNDLERAREIYQTIITELLGE